MLIVPHPLDLILMPRLDSVHLKPKWPPVKIGDSEWSRGDYEQSVIWADWGVRKLSIKQQGLIKKELDRKLTHDPDSKC